MSKPTTPAALLNELAILRRQNKRLADRLDTQKGERRQIVIERTIDRAFLDACALYTLAIGGADVGRQYSPCLLYTSPSPRDRTRSRMPSSA